MSTHSPENRKLLVAAFKEALTYLAKDNSELCYRGKKSNICGCLSKAWHDDKVENRVREMATNIVMKRLGTYSYYESWVRNRVGDKAVNYDRDHNSSKKIQDGRRRWLKSLIKEFSS